MTSPIACHFFSSAHDNRGVRVNTTWDALAERCIRHVEGPKDGPAIACASFKPGMARGNAALVARTLIALDIEMNSTTGEVPPPFASVVADLRRLRVQSVAWTTHSHSPEAPRYRLLLSLSAPIPYDAEIDPHLAAGVAGHLGLAGVCDPSKFGAASLFYLPRHPPGAASAAARIEGCPIHTGLLHTLGLTLAQDVARLAGEVEAGRRRYQMPTETRALIDAYNNTHPIAERLAAYGYRRHGNRWKSPVQHGAGATVILPGGDRWVSFSASDDANDVGARPSRPSSQATRFGDAFALCVRFEHGGDFRAALRALQAAQVQSDNTPNQQSANDA